MKTHFIKNKRCEAKKAVPKNMMSRKDGPDNYGRGGGGGGNFRGGKCVRLQKKTVRQY